jgi:serine/threonine-protein kinase
VGRTLVKEASGAGEEERVSASLSSIRVVPAAGPAATGVGKYQYIAMLAEGGMANVYLAVTKGQANFEKLVVIKELRDTLAQDPTFVAMFMDEARLAARLNHPNVVATYEVGSDGDRHFIAMEFLEGVAYTRLARTRDRIPPPLAIHVRILCDVLYGLHYAHELRDFDGKPLAVVHRDVSPQNVMLSFAGGVKVLDFGIAKAALAAEQRPDDFKGKLEYMAPEQALLQDVDRRADVFSVGIMLWEAIARRRLYLKGEDKFARLVSGELPDVLSVRADAPRKLVQICKRALVRERTYRYPTAQDMAHDLEEWLDGTTQHVRQRDIGGYVSEKFAATRTKLTEAIEAQLKLVRELPADAEQASIPLSRIPVNDTVPPPGASGAPSELQAEAVKLANTMPLPAPAPSGPLAAPPPFPPPSTPANPTAPPWAVAPAAGATTGPAPREAARVARPGAALYGIAAVGVVALLAVAGVVVVQRRAPKAALAATVTSSAAPGGAATTTPSSTEIDFTIRASPTQARISIDGQPEPKNPAVGRRPRDGAVHVVRVEAPGYETREEQITFDRSMLVTLELHQTTLTAPTSTITTTTGASTARRFVGGSSQKTGPRPGSKPNIDTENPYQ